MFFSHMTVQVSVDFSKKCFSSNRVRRTRALPILNKQIPRLLCPLPSQPQEGREPVGETQPYSKASAKILFSENRTHGPSSLRGQAEKHRPSWATPQPPLHYSVFLWTASCHLHPCLVSPSQTFLCSPLALTPRAVESILGHITYSISTLGRSFFHPYRQLLKTFTTLFKSTLLPTNPQL